MLKRVIVSIVAIVVLIGLTQCHGPKSDLVGVWQLDEMQVNGTVLKGSSLGNWLWEFNDAGGFLTDVAGMREKGVYTLKDGTLTLKITTVKDKVDQVYKVAKLDSVQLNLVSPGLQNQSSMRFVKRKVSDVVKEDKD